MLGIRLREGIAVGNTPPSAVASLIADELIVPAATFAGRIQLTQRRGRLVADTVDRTLWEAEESSRSGTTSSVLSSCSLACRSSTRPARWRQKKSQG